MEAAKCSSPKLIKSPAIPRAITEVIGRTRFGPSARCQTLTRLRDQSAWCFLYGKKCCTAATIVLAELLGSPVLHNYSGKSATFSSSRPGVTNEVRVTLRVERKAKKRPTASRYLASGHGSINLSLRRPVRTCFCATRLPRSFWATYILVLTSKGIVAVCLPGCPR